MYRRLASNRAVWVLGLLVSTSTVILIIVICLLWGDATKGTAPCNAQGRSAPPAQPSSAASKVTSPSPQQSPGGSAPATSANPAAGSPGAEPTGAAGAGSTSNLPNNAGKTPDKQPEVSPSQATLSTCETVPLKVLGVAESDVTWPEVLTGSLSNDGVYAAPTSITGQQILRIGATVKVGNQTQTAKAATIILMPPAGPAEVNVLIMIALMGALGGCLHWIGGFTFFVGNREFLRSWTAYWLLMPIEGAALAIIVYMLFRVGILAPGSASGQATATLNTIALYAIAGLTGIYSKQALSSLGDVFNVVFKKVQAKDESKTEVKADKPKA